MKKFMEKLKNLPPWINAIAAIFAAGATIGLFFVASWINQTYHSVLKLQEAVLKIQESELTGRKVANIEVIRIRGNLTKEPDASDAYWIDSRVTFRNTSKDNLARKVQIVYQAFDGYDWTGFSNMWRKSDNDMEMADIELKPDEKFETIMQAHTSAKPRDKCQEGKSFFIASRIDWLNPNGATGCRTTFIKFKCPIGPIAGRGEILIRPVPWPPKSEVKPPPAIWPCPE